MTKIKESARRAVDNARAAMNLASWAALAVESGDLPPEAAADIARQAAAAAHNAARAVTAIGTYREYRRLAVVQEAADRAGEAYRNAAAMVSCIKKRPSAALAAHARAFAETQKANAESWDAFAKVVDKEQEP